MSHHKQITTCRKNGGPLSRFCSCEHCCLDVCAICGCSEGSLTTDCPGTAVDANKQREIYETPLDFTDEQGWHLGESTARRTPRFEDTKCPPAPPPVDPRAAVMPSIDWTAIDHTMHLQHQLAQKAIAWVLADRACEDRSAALARIEDETGLLRGKTELDASARELLGTLEKEKISFKLACKTVDRCKNEWEQVARRLVATLESAR